MAHGKEQDKGRNGIGICSTCGLDRRKLPGASVSWRWLPRRFAGRGRRRSSNSFPC